MNVRDDPSCVPLYCYQSSYLDSVACWETAAKLISRGVCLATSIGDSDDARLKVNYNEIIKNWFLKGISIVLTFHVTFQKPHYVVSIGFCS